MLATFRPSLARQGNSCTGTRTLAFLLGAIAPVQGLWAFEPTFEAEPLSRADFAPQLVAAVPGGGYWVSGSIGERAALVRYGSSDSVDLIRFIPFAEELRSASDGGVFAIARESETDFNYVCTVRRYDGSGASRWATASAGFGCKAFVTVPDGSSWLLTGAVSPDPNVEMLFRLDAAGIARDFSSALAELRDTTVAAVATASELIITGKGRETSVGVVRSISPSGTSTLRYQRADTAFEGIAAFPDGSVAVVGYEPSAGPASATVAVRVSAAGSPRWIFRSDSIDSYSIAVVALGERTVLVEEADGGPALHIRSLDADGRLEWHRTFNNRVCAGEGACIVEGTPNGITIRGETNDGEGFSDAIFEIDHAGNLVRATGFNGADIRDSASLAGGATLVVTGTHVGGGAPTRYELVRLTPGAAATTPAVTGIADAPSLILATGKSADGGNYTLTRDLANEKYALARFDNNGTPAATRTSGGVWTSAELHASGTRVCIAGRRADTRREAAFATVECFAASDLSPLWRRPLRESLFGAIAAGLRSNNETVVAYSAGADVYRAVLSANGAVIVEDQVITRFAERASIDSEGYAFVQYGSRLLAIGPEGQQRYDVVSGDGHFSTIGLVPTGAGSLVTFDLRMTTVPATLTATQLDAQGGIQWTTTLGSPTTGASVVDTAAIAGDIYFVARQNAFSGGFPRRPLEALGGRIALDSGVVRWTRALPFHVSDSLDFAVDETRGVVHLASSWHRHVTRFVLDAASGTTTNSVSHDCSVDRCLVFALNIDADDRLSVDVQTHTEVRGWRPRRYVETNASVRAPRLPPGQPAIAGTWYSPYCAGQGFVIDWIPSSGTLFAPWFTYSRDGPNDPAGLRWFALQGLVSNTDTVANLAILQSDNGRFASGPSTTPQQVGTAQLDFSDCNTIALRYDFDASVNDGRSGVVRLERLIPGATPCDLGAPPTPSGSSRRYSGSWYLPATSGQGIMFSIGPEDAVGSSLLFASWFSYDPMTPDDPTTQTWLVIQGSIRGDTAANLPIFRTIGGSFDSRPTSNTARVGTATVSFVACDRARLEYQFDDAEAALPFRSLSGVMDLERIGGCAP
jgi:hypothetical protein